MDLVAKTELPTQGVSRLSSITIPALGPILTDGLEEDRTMCPVRALKVYLARTKDIRE